MFHGVAPSWMVGVSASVNLPLHHKVQFSSGTSSPGWSQKRGCNMVVCACVFPAKTELAASYYWIFFVFCSIKETLRITGTGFYRPYAFPVS